MQITYLYNDETLVLDAEADGDGWRVSLPDGTKHRIAVTRLPGDVLQITRTEDASNPDADALSAEQVYCVPFARTERGLEIAFHGETFAFAPEQARRSAGKTGIASGSLIAPMVGVVAEVLVTEGETVAAYQPLVIVEAMKVMATLEAPFAGTVRKVYVKKSERVAHGAPVIDITPNV
jgi:biotin carboxyl carrier protein